MVQQLEDAFEQCLHICISSDIIMYILAAALIYVAFEVLFVGRKSVTY